MPRCSSRTPTLVAVVVKTAIITMVDVTITTREEWDVVDHLATCTTTTTIMVERRIEDNEMTHDAAIITTVVHNAPIASVATSEMAMLDTR